MRAEAGGHFFSVLDRGGGMVAICTTRRAAEHVAEAVQRGCEEAMLACLRLKQGGAIVEPR